MLTRYLIELLDVLLIRMTAGELLGILALVERELRLRGDACSANYVARAEHSHAFWVASDPPARSSPLP